MKNIDVVTLFPEILDEYINSSPFKKNLPSSIDISTHQLRDFSDDKHK